MLSHESVGNRTRLPLPVVCVVAGLALADTAGLGELPESVITGIGVENDWMGVEKIGGPGVGG